MLATLTSHTRKAVAPAWAVNTESAVRLKKGMLRSRKCRSSWPPVLTASRVATRWETENMVIT